MDLEKNPLLNFYNHPPLNEYLSHQLSQISYSSIKILHNFLVIETNFPEKTQSYHFSVDQQQIVFFIVLGKGFPVTRPRIYLKSNLSSPSFADCRDLYKNVMGKIWSVKSSLKQVYQRITHFLNTLEKKQDISYICRIGEFVLDIRYPVFLIRRLYEDRFFIGFERKEERLDMFFFAISQTHLNMFLAEKQPFYENQKIVIPEQKSITEGVLVFSAEIGSLIEIVFNRNDNTEVVLVFKAKKTMNMQLQQKICEKRLRIRKGSQFCHQLIKSMKNFEPIEMKIDMHKENMNKEEEKILRDIKEAEEQIEHHLNEKTIQRINDCYQMAIQYYSGQNIPHYEIFADKISRLYQRADVRVIMN